MTVCRPVMEGRDRPDKKRPLSLAVAIGVLLAVLLIVVSMSGCPGWGVALLGLGIGTTVGRLV